MDFRSRQTIYIRHLFSQWFPEDCNSSIVPFRKGSQKSYSLWLFHNHVEELRPFDLVLWKGSVSSTMSQPRRRVVTLWSCGFKGLWLIDNVLFMSKNYDSLVMSLRKIVTLTTFGIYSVLLNVDSDNVNYNFCRFWSMLILIYKFLQPPFVNNMVRRSHGRMSTSLSYEKKKKKTLIIMSLVFILKFIVWLLLSWSLSLVGGGLWRLIVRYISFSWLKHFNQNSNRGEALCFLSQT